MKILAFSGKVAKAVGGALFVALVIYVLVYSPAVALFLAFPAVGFGFLFIRWAFRGYPRCTNCLKLLVLAGKYAARRRLCDRCFEEEMARQSR
ncbi:MAG: hypothetical protein JSW71_05340 [Gemmatimonadota bacterium]|nr:MAG: hypothetical protein JSW71_05340 [Gemmatimonadota bacterium]